ncbi:MLO-like protein 8 [Juglans microcarpa x Juglans regia]|uniref:MLO-like protein 8 n=1 Tax=Juglans microcarpa x Juglans regia TaxID=2249226 RepID=UPI001B7DE87F|nr:MLO-like protein 8 [Juglans microcarpa x Juglans regia]
MTMFFRCHQCLCVWLLLRGGTAMAATESSDSQTRELDQTPTWAVAGVSAFIIIISMPWKRSFTNLERGLQKGRRTLCLKLWRRLKRVIHCYFDLMEPRNSYEL